jgi:acetyl-CoA carboxylase carboxyltransferase component
VTRLGQRVIQNQGPILLTGYDALNRLLGREIYISNTQMGGPAIMYKNGVRIMFCGLFCFFKKMEQNRFRTLM